MGLATARAFAAAGASVALADVNTAALTSAVDALTSEGRTAIGITCDVCDAEQVAAIVRRTVDSYGRLHMAFNNAGIQAPPTDAAEEPADLFDRVNAINLRGVWACMKHELTQMRRDPAGQHSDHAEAEEPSAYVPAATMPVPPGKASSNAC